MSLSCYRTNLEPIRRLYAVLYKYSPGCVRQGWGWVLDSRKTSGEVWTVAKRHLSFTNSCVASVRSGLCRVGPLSAQPVHFSCTCFSCIYYYWGMWILTFQYVDARWKSYVISCSKGMCPTNSAVQWLISHTHVKHKLFNTQSWANLLWLFWSFPRWVNKPWWSSQDQSGTCLVFTRGKDGGINTARTQLTLF